MSQTASRRTILRQTSPDLPYPAGTDQTTSHLPTPYLPYYTGTNRTLRELAAPYLPYLTRTILTVPRRTEPHLPYSTVPNRTMPHQALPCQTCPTEPDSAASNPTTPSLAPPAVPHRSAPSQAQAHLRCQGFYYLMPNFFVTSFWRSLGTTSNVPKPQPADDLESGRPSHKPTCPPTRAIRLYTSCAVN